MAKKSTVRKNKHRAKLVKLYAERRAKLRKVVYDKSLPLSERFESQLALSALPRNSSRTRVRNRCEITGRGRGYYRKFRISRICLRELAGSGLLPGVLKASW
jgi:small subunit ribosomal protein S14